MSKEIIAVTVCGNNHRILPTYPLFWQPYPNGRYAFFDSQDYQMSPNDNHYFPNAFSFIEYLIINLSALFCF